MLPSVPELYRRVARLFCLAAFVGAQIVAPSQVQWRESLSSDFNIGCSLCRSGCEVGSQTAAAVSQSSCSTERPPIASAPERHDPRPDPTDGRDCPVCRHVLTAGRILLAPGVELTNALWLCDTNYEVAHDQTPCVWMMGCPPVRGPPDSPLSPLETRETAIGVRNPIRSSAHISRQHGIRTCHECEVARAVCPTMPKNVGTMFSLSINPLSGNCCDETLLWTNSKSQRSGTC